MKNMDLIVTGGTIITMDDELPVIVDGVIAAKGDRIAHIGPQETEPSNRPRFQAPKVIDARGCLVLPGLINGHTHAAMTLFRGLADDLALMEWLQNYILPIERMMDGDFVYTGTMLACAEMILSGTTTFCDMYLFEQEVARAAADAGMRVLVGEVLYDFPSPNYGPVEAGLAYTQRLIDTWRGHPLVSIAVEPHTLYTCSADLLKKADELARKNDVPLIIHVAETLSELAMVQERSGLKPFAYMEQLSICGPHVVAAHCVHLDEGEMERIRRYGIRVVTNPESNMKLASGIAPVPELINRGIPVGIGTDGAASNNDLDLFSEMGTLAKLHKVHRLDPTVMDAFTVLKCATSEGARALGLDHIIGSLKVGKKADIIVVDGRQPHLIPLYHPYSQLVYCARGSDVVHSIIDGRLVMENRRLLTIDLAAVTATAREQARRALSWLPKSREIRLL